MATLEAEDFLSHELTAVVRSERAMLVRTAAREGLSAQDALECVQDALCTFLRMQRLGELAAPAAEWGPLLAGITRNAARNRRRRHAVARPHEPSAERAPSELLAADELLVRSQAHRRLQAGALVRIAVICLAKNDPEAKRDATRMLSEAYQIYTSLGLPVANAVRELASSLGLVFDSE